MGGRLLHVLYYSILLRILPDDQVLQCIILYYTILDSTILQYIILHYSVMYYPIP